ncbi:hypothetical protein MSC49_41610 (plasmid) [Methylosinus sp. C49]|nr:hypothetical protein MSC49_41610 [Methylosinus sp. C49]
MERVGAVAGECRRQGRTAPGRPHPADCCLICSVDRADKQAILLAILTGRAPFPEPLASAGSAAPAEDGGPRAPLACARSTSARGPPPVSPPIERSRRAA